MQSGSSGEFFELDYTLCERAAECGLASFITMAGALDQKAVDTRSETASEGNIGVAYTYNEPLIGYEFVEDCARFIVKQGQKNVLVTNGFVCREPMERLLPFIHAMNIDLKSFSPAVHLIKQAGGFSKEEASKFDRALVELQQKMYLTMCGRQQKQSQKREEYGWSSTVFCTAERFFGEETLEQAARITEREAVEKITALFIVLIPIRKKKRLKNS